MCNPLKLEYRFTYFEYKIKRKLKFKVTGMYENPV